MDMAYVGVFGVLGNPPLLEFVLITEVVATAEQ